MPIEIALNLAWVLLLAMLGLALPVGLGALAGRATRDREAWAPGRLLLVGLLAFLVFFAGGFSLQSGGAHAPTLGELPRLAWQWEPLGDGSGLFSWAGPLVPAEPGRLALFLLQAVGAITVAVLALAPVSWRLPGPGLVAAALLIAGALSPLLSHWAWGGGWLAGTGWTAYLGHGYVDWGGAGVYYALGGLLALAGLLATGARRGASAEPEGPDPRGAVPALAGVIALNLAAAWGFQDRLALVAVNTLVGAAAAGVVAVVYMAFTSARFRAPMLARGLLAGAVASAGIAPFAPPLTLALVGAAAGLLACLGSYLVERVWRLDDAAGIVPSFGLAGLWGVLSVGLFADGTYGQALHGIGEGSYLGVAGQGVSGIALLAPGMAADFAQLVAQLLGMLVILAWALGPGWLLFRLGTVRPPEQDRET